MHSLFFSPMQDLINYLAGFATPRRYELFRKVAGMRTRYITVVLEDIYQSHNASAVLRTCDCLGIQDVHVIEEKNRFSTNPDVELGSAQWLAIHRYRNPENNALEAINHLRNQGYRIVATTPHSNDKSLIDFDLNPGKIALFFGTEMKGLSDQVIKNADEYLRIPMTGFTESFNISVSVAIVLFELTRKLRDSDINWHMSPEETDELILNWLRNSVKHADLLEKKYTFDQQKRAEWESNR